MNQSKERYYVTINGRELELVRTNSHNLFVITGDLIDQWLKGAVSIDDELRVPLTLVCRESIEPMD